MQRHPSAVKAHRQSAKRAAANNSARSAVRTAIKALRTDLGQGGTKKKKSDVASKDVLEARLKTVQKLLMTAAKKGLVHKNNAARTISRLSAQVHALSK